MNLIRSRKTEEAALAYHEQNAYDHSRLPLAPLRAKEALNRIEHAEGTRLHLLAMRDFWAYYSLLRTSVALHDRIRADLP